MMCRALCGVALHPERHQLKPWQVQVAEGKFDVVFAMQAGTCLFGDGLAAARGHVCLEEDETDDGLEDALHHTGAAGTRAVGQSLS
jgi:hypothetical protein